MNPYGSSLTSRKELLAEQKWHPEDCNCYYSLKDLSKFLIYTQVWVEKILILTFNIFSFLCPAESIISLSHLILNFEGICGSLIMTTTVKSGGYLTLVKLQNYSAQIPVSLCLGRVPGQVQGGHWGALDKKWIQEKLVDALSLIYCPVFQLVDVHCPLQSALTLDHFVVQLTRPTGRQSEALQTLPTCKRRLSKQQFIKFFEGKRFQFHTPYI